MTSGLKYFAHTADTPNQYSGMGVERAAGCTLSAKGGTVAVYLRSCCRPPKNNGPRGGHSWQQAVPVSAPGRN